MTVKKENVVYYWTVGSHGKKPEYLHINEQKGRITMRNMTFWRTALVATLVLTVMLSVTGGTIAWFTDTVESKDNKIEAGTLDIALYKLTNNTTAPWEEITDESEPLFNSVLWEPGYTA